MTLLRLFGVLLLPAVFTLGCAHSPPLTGPALKTAEQAWQAFLSRECSRCIDSDLSLQWRLFTNRGALPGMLQLRDPDHARLTITDPLGRPQWILAAAGRTFRAVLVSEGRGWQGEETWPGRRRYLPPEVDGGALFAWLSGGLHDTGMQLERIAADSGGEGVWYEFAEREGLIHRVLLDGGRPVMRRHLLMSAEGHRIFEARYLRYRQVGDCLWPFEIRMEADTGPGELILRYQRVIPVDRFPEDAFRLEFPPGFRVEILR